MLVCEPLDLSGLGLENLTPEQDNLAQSCLRDVFGRYQSTATSIATALNSNTFALSGIQQLQQESSGGGGGSGHGGETIALANQALQQVRSNLQQIVDHLGQQLLTVSGLLPWRSVMSLS